MASEAAARVHATVICASPGVIDLREVDLPRGATLRDAIVASGLLSAWPQLDLEVSEVGVFSRILPLDTPVQSGDQIEIYRPLTIDPKEARRLRAQIHARRKTARR